MTPAQTTKALRDIYTQPETFMGAIFTLKAIGVATLSVCPTCLSELSKFPGAAHQHSLGEMLATSGLADSVNCERHRVVKATRKKETDAA